MDTSKIKYIVFDVFGTCVDWHGTILKAGKKLSEKYDLEVDWSSLAREWRIDGYFKAVFETAAGKREYVPCDEVFMGFLKETLVPKYHMEAVSEEDLRDFCNVWHRLQPWEDVLDGLHRLTTKYAIGPFTNGDFDLMIDLKKNSADPIPPHILGYVHCRGTSLQLLIFSSDTNRIWRFIKMRSDCFMQSRKRL